MTRPTRITCLGIAVACYLVLLALDPFVGTTRPVVLAHVVVLLSQAYFLVQLIRGRPLPELTLQRVRVLRRQNAVGTLVWLGLGVVLVLVWRGSTDPDRAAYIWLAAALGLSAVVSAVNAVRQSLVLRRGEVPVGMRRRWNAVSRRRVG